MTIGDSHPPFGSYRLALMSLPTDQVTRACPDGFMASPNGEGQSVYESTRLAGGQPTPVSYRLAPLSTFPPLPFPPNSSPPPPGTRGPAGIPGEGPPAGPPRVGGLEPLRSAPTRPRNESVVPRIPVEAGIVLGPRGDRVSLSVDGQLDSPGVGPRVLVNPLRHPPSLADQEPVAPDRVRVRAGGGLFKPYGDGVPLRVRADRGLGSPKVRLLDSHRRAPALPVGVPVRPYDGTGIGAPERHLLPHGDRVAQPIDGNVRQHRKGIDLLDDLGDPPALLDVVPVRPDVHEPICVELRPDDERVPRGFNR